MSLPNSLRARPTLSPAFNEPVLCSLAQSTRSAYACTVATPLSLSLAPSAKRAHTAALLVTLQGVQNLGTQPALDDLRLLATASTPCCCAVRPRSRRFATTSQDPRAHTTFQMSAAVLRLPGVRVARRAETSPASKVLESSDALQRHCSRLHERKERSGGTGVARHRVRKAIVEQLVHGRGGSPTMRTCSDSEASKGAKGEVKGEDTRTMRKARCVGVLSQPWRGRALLLASIPLVR